MWLGEYPNLISTWSRTFTPASARPRRPHLYTQRWHCQRRAYIVRLPGGSCSAHAMSVLEKGMKRKKKKVFLRRVLGLRTWEARLSSLQQPLPTTSAPWETRAAAKMPDARTVGDPDRARRSAATKFGDRVHVRRKHSNSHQSVVQVGRGVYVRYIHTRNSLAGGNQQCQHNRGMWHCYRHKKISRRVCKGRCSVN